MNDGQSQTVATQGPLSLEAICEPNFTIAGRTGAIMRGATTVDDDVVASGATVFDGQNTGFLTPATPPDERELELLGENAATEDPLVITRGAAGVTIMSASGDFIGIDMQTSSIGVNYAGADCFFQGHYTTRAA